MLPISPISLPCDAVIILITAIVIKIPTAKISEILNVRPKEIFPCELINPTTSGMLDKWHGERSMDNTPYPNDAITASQTAPIIARAISPVQAGKHCLQIQDYILSLLQLHFHQSSYRFIILTIIHIHKNVFSVKR